ncbi:hypothetical protein B0H16DRAFT_1686164 [Mycena metata]|uniref:Transmembrane protein n=1 Tax=Mycena metata TaxID=1033252 RepID=A0AAD7NP90_9AGAR|nr:hypothetical protein B0H16DRAFT_1686164 [Mycena metata]
MNEDPPSPIRLRGREYIAELERRYGVPAKEFLKESYEEHPLATTAVVIFAVTSFTPVVGAAALAVFTVCLALCATLVTIIGLGKCPTGFLELLFLIVAPALGLATLLSTTLFSSLVLTFLVAGAIRLRSARHLAHQTVRRAAHDQTETPEASSAPPKRRRFPGIPGMRFRRSLGFHRRGSWKARALLLFILCEAVSRIRLPRVVRYTFLYRTLFGATLFGPRRTHFLQRGLSLPFILMRGALWMLPSTGLKVARAPIRLFGGWKAPVTIYLVLLLLSPRLRAAARSRLAHTGRHLGAAAGRAARTVLRSEQVARVYGLPWKAYVATALEYAQVVLTLLIEFVHVQLAQLGDKAGEVPEAGSAEEPTPAGFTGTVVATPEEPAAAAGPTQPQTEDAGSEYEMVSVASGHGGDQDAVVPPMAAPTETLRFRKVSAAMAEEA